MSIKVSDTVAIGFKFIGVNSQPMLLRSTDSGSTWIESNLDLGDASEIIGVACSSTLFVIVTDAFEAYYSTNGSTWVQSSLGPAGEILTSLTYSQGMFIVTSRRNGIYFSTDGITWSKNTVNNLPASSALTSAARYTGGFITTGIDFSGSTYAAGTPYIATSMDGITWGVRFFGNASSPRPVNIVVADELQLVFVLYGSALDLGTSLVVYPLRLDLGGTNPPTTVLTNIPVQPSSILWTGNEVLLVTPYGRIYRSTNGISFNTVRDNTTTEYMSSAIAYGNGRAIATPLSIAISTS
jgi:hypothetical protein